MTKQLDHDSKPQNELLPFRPGELDRSGLRLTRAEFARFLQVSKQAVGEWVTAGKITLGPDGRLDPRQAVSQLMRNTDPARIRSKVLAPLIKEVGALQSRISDLEKKLAATEEEADFHESTSLEMIQHQDQLLRCLQLERDELAKLPADKVIGAITGWVQQVFISGNFRDDLSISDCFSADAPVESGGGGE